MARWRLYVALLAFLLSSAPVFPRAVQAQAGKAAAALAVFKKGRSLFRAGQYQAAIKALGRSLALKAHRNTLYYLGASYRRLGAFRRAYSFYRRYAQQFPAAKAGPMLARYVKQLRWAPPCLLTVRSTPPGALVKLGSTVLGRTEAGKALSKTISGGTHTLIVERGGCVPQRLVVVAEYGEPLVRDVRLVAVSKPPSTLRASPTPPTRPQRAPLPAPKAPKKAPKKESASPSPWALEIGTGLTFVNVNIKRASDPTAEHEAGGIEAALSLHYGSDPGRDWRWYATLETYGIITAEPFLSFSLGGGLGRRIAGNWMVDLRLLAGGLLAMGLDSEHPLVRDDSDREHTVTVGSVGLLPAFSAVLALEWQLAARWALRIPFRVAFTPVNGHFSSEATAIWILGGALALRWRL